MLEKGIDNKWYNVINRSDFLQKEFQLLDKFRDVKYKNWYRLTNQHQMNPISRESILKPTGTIYAGLICKNNISKSEMIMMVSGSILNRD